MQFLFPYLYWAFSKIHVISSYRIFTTAPRLLQQWSSALKATVRYCIGQISSLLHTMKKQYNIWQYLHCPRVPVPSIEERLGRIVTAPTATSSSWWIGLLLAPQLSDPIHRKWPTWLVLLVALRTPLQRHLLWIWTEHNRCLEFSVYHTKKPQVLRTLWAHGHILLQCTLLNDEWERSRNLLFCVRY